MRSSLLHEVVENTAAAFAGSATRLEAFLSERDDWEALAVWLQLTPGHEATTRDELQARLMRDVAYVDDLLSAQVDAILHAPAFQGLEASWRGLRSLTECIEDEDQVRIRVLDVTWKELARDLERAIEFDQSETFRKVYSAEFGMPGGTPYGLLLGDFEVTHRPTPEHPTNDTECLRSLAEVAAASFAPFVAGASPALLGLERFSDLERPMNLHRTFQSPDYTKWNSLRASEDVRFVGLTVPRVLMRSPWGDTSGRADGFRYVEDVSDPDRGAYLWGTGVWAFGSVVIRSFSESGWLADIHGVERGVEGGGLVTNLCVDSFGTDEDGLIPRPATDLIVTDAREKELCDLGLLPLSHCPGTDLAAFYSCRSIQEPKKLTREDATVSARLSAMLHYMLCVSRFAHYVKVIARDRVGSFATAEECQRYLNDWLVDYSTSAEDVSRELQAEYPLREARVEVRELPGRPGVFGSVVHLRPHYQLDQMSIGLRLVTELVGLEK